MRMHELETPNRKSRKRVGRGVGSGMGKTAGRGHKGLLSRSGGSSKPGFEGGQMPLQRRLPKRGFHHPFRVRMAVVNLRDLARLETDGPITIETMRKAGLVKGSFDGVKVLGTGELERPLTVEASAFSAGAKQRIEAAGGTANVVCVSRAPETH